MSIYPEYKGINFSKEFLKNMYHSMWQYFNLEVIQDIFYKLGTKEELRINIDNKCICFKGNSKDGHYFYIKDFKAYGTFECNLLNNESDNGVCHSIAIIFALKEYIPKYGKLFNIKIFPKTKLEYINNYLIILKFYKWLIESKTWDYVIEFHFPKETIGKSKKALVYLDTEIKRLLLVKINL